MPIDNYVAQMEATIRSYPIIQDFTLNLRRDNDTVGLIWGRLTFQDSSTLHFRECMNFGSASPRLSYSYHYMDAAQQLIFRYDNTNHHKKLCLPTFPHHKHAGSEATILPSSPPDLPTVLQEILTLLDPAQA